MQQPCLARSPAEPLLTSRGPGTAWHTHRGAIRVLPGTPRLCRGARRGRTSLGQRRSAATRTGSIRPRGPRRDRGLAGLPPQRPQRATFISVLVVLVGETRLELLGEGDEGGRPRSSRAITSSR